MRSWKATLSLHYDLRADRTVLTHRRHSGPLAVQKTFHPEHSVCHTVLLHPPGGLAAGDELAIDLSLASHTHTLVTTPGAAKWYRGDGEPARVHTMALVADGAVLEYLPQETVLFNGVHGENRTDVELTGTARYVGWDITALGRPASGEAYTDGQFRQHWRIARAGHTLFEERLTLRGGDRLLSSPLGLSGRRVLGTVIAAGYDLRRPWLATLRETAGGDGLCGLTLLPEVLIARYLGDTTEAARGWCEGLWSRLRPLWLGRSACPPRIWST